MTLYEKVEYFIDLYSSDDNRIQFIKNLRLIMNEYAKNAIQLKKIPETVDSVEIDKL